MEEEEEEEEERKKHLLYCNTNKEERGEEWG
jgi:hypothetical protein